MHQAISQLKHITNVESVTPVTGRFDVVIKLRTNDPEKAFNAIERIREIDDVTATQTGLSLQHVSNPHEQQPEQPIAFALMKVKLTPVSAQLGPLLRIRIRAATKVAWSKRDMAQGQL